MTGRARPGWNLLAVLLFAGVSAEVARAEPAGFRQPLAGTRLEPGQIVEVSWNLGSTRHRDFDEAELLFSLDGGKTFPLRVTREVSPSAMRVSWRVPDFPTEHGRLALRAGADEDSESEEVQFVSSEFAVERRPGESLEELFLVHGEWRTKDALSSPRELPAPSLFEPPIEQILAPAARARAAELPTSVELPAGRDRATGLPRGRNAFPTIERVAASGSPLFLPLRQ